MSSFIKYSWVSNRSSLGDPRSSQLDLLRIFGRYARTMGTRNRVIVLLAMKCGKYE